jgi:hypothetical protein
VKVRVQSVTRQGSVGGNINLVSTTEEPLLPGCEALVVDIAYRWGRWLFKSGAQVTYSGHRAALVYLADAANAKQPITFAAIGGSLIPDQTRPCHLVSAGLSLQKTDNGQTVVSFHDAD